MLKAVSLDRLKIKTEPGSSAQKETTNHSSDDKNIFIPSKIAEIKFSYLNDSKMFFFHRFLAKYRPMIPAICWKRCDLTIPWDKSKITLLSAKFLQD